jgi:hypothetical protein
MEQKKAALTTETKLDNETITDVKVKRKFTVTYIIKIGSSPSLNLPYAVVVNGTVREDFKKNTKRVSGKGGRITVANLDAGSRVELFLNSDAHPSHRKNPVYCILCKNRDVIVQITERSGKRTETDTPFQCISDSVASQTSLSNDCYDAVLNGDIWMRISHKYSVSEIENLIPQNTPDSIRICLRSIYNGLSHASLEIIVSSAGTSKVDRKILVTFEDGENPRNNISSGYDLLKEGLKRVHPAGYVALFIAAIETNVDKLVLTSAWRPMLGSIAHRAGLGLDVNYVGANRLNRVALLDTKLPISKNVSQAERDLFGELKEAKARQVAAKEKVNALNRELNIASRDSTKILDAKQKLREATEESMSADLSVKKAANAWNSERDKNEPDEVRRFRAALMKDQTVVQIFDPWFMDQNTRDDVAGVPNMQQSRNEELHSHHLHITVYDPYML